MASDQRSRPADAPPHSAPVGFSDEELLALLRDQSVRPEAIVSEMVDAGAEPLEAGLLAEARRALLTQDPQTVPAVEKLPEALRRAVLDAAVAARSVPFLTALATSNDRAVAKDAKRAIHLLRSRGVAVEAPRRPPAAPPPAPPPAAEEPVFVTAPDSYGERLLFYPSTGRTGVSVAQLVLSDEHGIASAQVVTLGKREYRRFIERLISGAGQVLCGEAPRAWARGLITAALDLNAKAGRPVPEGFNDVAYIIGPAVAPQPSPGRTLPAPQEPLAAERRSGELLQLPELRTWMPDEQTLHALALRLDEIAVSPLYIDEQQRAASSRTAVNDAIQSWWTAARRQRFAERLFDAAWLLHQTGRDEHAGVAVAAATALESDRPLESISFCYAVFERVVRLLGSREEPARQPAPEPSSSGLILP